MQGPGSGIAAPVNLYFSWKGEIMSEMAKRLLEQRAAVWHKAKEMLDAADAQNRSLTADENRQYDEMTKDLDELRARADKFTEDEANAQAAADSLRKYTESSTRQDENDPRVKDEANLRNFLTKGSNMRSVDFAPHSVEEARALSKGSATAGGNTVPTSFYSQLWEHLIESATLMGGGATVLNTSSGENLEMPITTSFGAAAAVSEGGPLAGTDPAFGKRILGSFKYAQLVVVSSELVKDSAFNLEGFLARVVGRNVGNAFGAKLITGAGTTEPTGITVSSTLGKTGAASVVGVPSMDDLIDLFYSVIAPYRNQPEAKWLMKDSTAAVIRKFKDTTNQYIWQPSVIEGQPDRLLNKGVLTDPNVAGTGLSAKSVLFGDLSAYAVRVVNGISFERSDEYLFGNDQVAFRAILRGDGLLIDQTGAVKHFIGNAA